MSEQVENSESIAQQQRIVDICWRAREILATHMFAATVLDSTHNQDDPDSSLSWYEDGVSVHETDTMGADNNWCGSLTNAPIIEVIEGKAIYLTEPGYVALRLDHVTGDQEPRQYIFRLEAPGTDATIYEGWAFDDVNVISPNRTRQVNRIAKMLQSMSIGYRSAAQTDPRHLSDTYHARVPQPSIDVIFQKLFKKYEDQ